MSIPFQYISSFLCQDILATTSDYPESLSKTIAAIKEMVPVEVPLPVFDTIFDSQDAISSKMAEQLESLAHHYDNMSNALHDFEAGEEFSEEDMQGTTASPLRRQCLTRPMML